jgi:hypothetical protein
MKKRAQAWGFDIIVAVGIFIFGMITFFLYTINYPNGEQEKRDTLLYEGNIIADNLLSTGNPENWTDETVSKIGIANENNTIDQIKLNQLYSLALTEYKRTKSIFGINNNYFINFSESIEIEGSPVEGIGLIPQEAKNSLKVSRISIYQNKPVTIEVQVWD